MTVACSSEAQRDDHVRKGDAHREAGRLTEAILEYRTAVEKDGRSGEARARLARAYIAAGNLSSALGEYARAADLLPKDTALQLETGRALLAAGRFEDARGRADEVLKSDPAHVQALVLRGNALAGMRDVEGGIADLERAAAIDNKGSTLVNLAGLRVAIGSKQAEATFKEAIASDRNSANGYLALAAYYRFIGNIEQAEALLKEALQRDPESLQANERLAELYLVTGRSAAAEAPLKRMADASANPQPWLVLADYYVGQNRLAEARGVLDRLSKYPEAHTATIARRAGLEYQEGRVAEAYKLIDEAIAREPGNAQLLFVKGGWLLTEQKIDQALELAAAAVKANPQYSDAHALVGAVRVAQNLTLEAIDAYAEALRLSPSSFSAQLELARLNLALKKFDSAASYAGQAVKGRPLHGPARVYLVSALLGQGSLNQAALEITPLMDGARDRPEVHVLFGDLQSRLGDQGAARRSYEKALTVNSGYLPAIDALVRLDVAEKNMAAATRRAETLVADRPDDAKGLVLAARTHSMVGEHARAETLLRKAIDLDRSSMPAYQLLAQVYIRQNKLQPALDEYAALAKRQPKDVGALTMMALLLHVQNRVAEAQKQYEHVLTVDPRAAVAANNLAYLHAEAGTDLDRALNLAQAAKAELPDDPDVDDTLAWVYVKKDLASMAISPLERSIGADPNNPTYKYHLGVAYMKIGQNVKAKRAFEEALELNANFAEAADARKALSSL
jgi:tetratricopeptide (TPR) repeat protein